MYFKTLISIICLGMSGFSFGQSSEPKSDTFLSALPNKCVALHKGRTCYAQITMRFSVPRPGQYCLLRREDEKVIACEAIERYGLFKLQFESTSKQAYLLVEQLTKKEVAQAMIDVAWVHQKKSRKRRWRLF